MNYAERDNLDGWVMKFKVYKQYPIAGRLVTPPTGLKLTKDELAKFNGKQEVPEGYAIAPIYICMKGKVGRKQALVVVAWLVDNPHESS